MKKARDKLESVASDILGKSCRAILAAMIDGESAPKKLADMALGRLESKHQELLAALRGKVFHPDWQFNSRHPR